MTNPRCGYVALIGRPNVGKSTLLNHLLEYKLSITSRKPQTTRRVLLGVDTREHVQTIYVDTPGIHTNANNAINRTMVKAARSVLADVDLILFLVDQTRWTEEDEWVSELIGRVDKPCLALLNKIDLLEKKEELLPAMARLGEKGQFEEIVPISALREEGLAELRELVAARLPEQAHFFPPDQLTDQSERFLVAEIIREKLMRRMGDELPHHLAVVVEQFSEEKNITDIAAEIYVEREGQKRIVIGKQGSKLKSIGTEARVDIEALLGRKVMLRLWVKVRSGWTNNSAALKRLGYE